MQTKLLAFIDLAYVLKHRNSELINDLHLQIRRKGTNLVSSHEHIFEATSVLPDVISRTKWEHIVNTLSRGLQKIIPGSNDILERPADFMQQMNKSMRTMVDDYLKKFPDEKIAMTAIALDFRDFPGDPIVSLEEQLDTMATLAKMPEYKGLLLPVVPINPNNPELDAIIAKAFRSGFIGGKFYASLGAYPTHPRAMALWALFEKYDIPVFVHSSQVGIFTPHTRLSMPRRVFKEDGSYEDVVEEKKFWLFNFKPSRLFERLKRFDRTNWQDLNDPAEWEAVLKQYPNLKICFSHLGGRKQIMRLKKGLEQGKDFAEIDSWTAKIFDLMRRYPNIYCDFSYVSSYPEVNQFLAELMLKHQYIKEKMLFALDSPLNRLVSDTNITLRDIRAKYADHYPQRFLMNFRKFMGI